MRVRGVAAENIVRQRKHGACGLTGLTSLEVASAVGIGPELSFLAGITLLLNKARDSDVV